MIARQLRRKKIGMNPLQKRKAVSPVIATVILVAVAITVAVGVSYWMGGISSQYTQFEKVEIQTGYATVITGGWNVTLELKNSGSATATLTHAFLNEKPVDDYGAAAGGNSTIADEIHVSFPATGLTLESGQSGTVFVLVSSGTVTQLTSGTTVNIKLHSAGGMDYIKLIRLT
jgi:flagellin-like protein